MAASPDMLLYPSSNTDLLGMMQIQVHKFK